MNSNLFIAICFFLVGHLLSWYGSNLQFVSPWWKERSVLLTCVIAIPTGLMWLYGTRYIMQWTIRACGHQGLLPSLCHI